MRRLSAAALAWAIVAGSPIAAIVARSAIAEDGASPRGVFQAAQGFLARDGGRWVSFNRRYEEGGPLPRWFGLEFAWAPEPHAVQGRIYGIGDDGELRQYWTMWTVWDPAREQARHFQMAGNGTWGEGPIEFETPAVHRVSVEGARPDGTAVRFKDRLVETGQDSMQTRTTLWQDGAWQEGPLESWHRVESFDPQSWSAGVGEPEQAPVG